MIIKKRIFLVLTFLFLSATITASSVNTFSYLLPSMIIANSKNCEHESKTLSKVEEETFFNFGRDIFQDSKDKRVYLATVKKEVYVCEECGQEISRKTLVSATLATKEETELFIKLNNFINFSAFCIIFILLLIVIFLVFYASIR